jgi:hypothetical protein
MARGGGARSQKTTAKKGGHLPIDFPLRVEISVSLQHYLVSIFRERHESLLPRDSHVPGYNREEDLKIRLLNEIYDR